jgi:hypothetical protein
MLLNQQTESSWSFGGIPDLANNFTTPVPANPPLSVCSSTSTVVDTTLPLSLSISRSFSDQSRASSRRSSGLTEAGTLPLLGSFRSTEAPFSHFKKKNDEVVIHFTSHKIWHRYGTLGRSALATINLAGDE